MTAIVEAPAPVPGVTQAPPGSDLPLWLTILLAAACGLIVANLYVSQPLVGPIGASLGMSPAARGLIPTMAQLGYGAGLLLIVPLGDLVENRRLIVCALGLAVAALAGAALSTRAAAFLAASLLIGLGSVAAQILVPYASHLASDANRGRVVGNVMGGLMLGIMLARPAASVVAEAASWHAVFALLAAAMVGLAVVLRLALPPRRPAPGHSYAALLASMGRLAAHTPVLQRRALYHACLFAAFSLFWTAVPLLLVDVYHLSQNGIAAFALVGVAGVIAAPLAGRAADRGWTRPATALAMAAVLVSLLLARLGLGGSRPGLAALLAASVLLDLGVTANNVLGQRAIYQLEAGIRSRLNGLYMATFFAGGAAGSALGGWAYARGGWSLTLWFGLALPALALAGFLTDRPRASPGLKST